jgi:hypothetical protein
MPLLAHFKGTAGIAAVAGAVLVGLTGAFAAVNPGLVRPPDGWGLAKPALKIAKETLRQRKGTSPTTTPRLKTSPGPPTVKINPGPPGHLKANPGPPNMRKVNPGLPAVQINPGPPTRR